MWRHCKDSTAKWDSPNDKFKHAVYSHMTRNYHLQIITSMYSLFPIEYMKLKDHMAVKYTISVMLIRPLTVPFRRGLTWSTPSPDPSGVRSEARIVLPPLNWWLVTLLSQSCGWGPTTSNKCRYRSAVKKSFSKSQFIPWLGDCSPSTTKWAEVNMKCWKL